METNKDLTKKYPEELLLCGTKKMPTKRRPQTIKLRSRNFGQRGYTTGKARLVMPCLPSQSARRVNEVNCMIYDFGKQIVNFTGEDAYAKKEKCGSYRSMFSSQRKPFLKPARTIISNKSPQPLKILFKKNQDITICPIRVQFTNPTTYIKERCLKEYEEFQIYKARLLQLQASHYKQFEITKEFLRKCFGNSFVDEAKLTKFINLAINNKLDLDPKISLSENLRRAIFPQNERSKASPSNLSKSPRTTTLKHRKLYKKEGVFSLHSPHSKKFEEVLEKYIGHTIDASTLSNRKCYTQRAYAELEAAIARKNRLTLEKVMLKRVRNLRADDILVKNEEQSLFQVDNFML